MIEIEFKFPVASLDFVRERVVELAGDIAVPVTQIERDTYFNHPDLRFDQCDKALRIRQVGNKNVLTFKGPRQDAAAKIRQEVEMSLSDDDVTQMWAILTGLGMSAVATVEKQRTTFSFDYKSFPVSVCLDEVTDVGSFAEVETVVATAADVSLASAAIDSLVEHLGLDPADAIPTSYLGLLLDRTNANES